MTLDLTPAQAAVLAGLLDQAIKTIGIRAMEDDVIDLMRVVKAAAQAQAQAQQMQQIQAQADAAAKLGTVKTNEANAASDLIGMFSGYGGV